MTATDKFFDIFQRRHEIPRDLSSWSGSTLFSKDGIEFGERYTHSG